MEAAGDQTLFLEKLNLLCELSKLKSSGIILSQNFNMQSDLNALKWEYQLQKKLAELKNDSRVYENCNSDVVNKLSTIESKLDLLLANRNY